MVHGKLTPVTSSAINPPGPRELILWLLRLRRRFRVAGDSMRPLLAPGDELLVDAGAYRRSMPAVGDVVVTRHPYRTDVHLVKRILSVEPDGTCVLRGDNLADSTDSRSFGEVSRDLLIGRVTAKFD